MAKIKNMSIVNMMSSREAQEKHWDNPAGWKAYARHIQKHPALKKMLFEKCGGICQFCGEKLSEDNFLLHHDDYDHVCIHPELMKVESPTASNPTGKVEVPDCLHCENMQSCIQHLHPVHSGCNRDIDLLATRTGHKEGKIYNYEWIASHLKKAI